MGVKVRRLFTIEGVFSVWTPYPLLKEVAGKLSWHRSDIAGAGQSLRPK
jgi:hypothetical protein